MSPHLSFRRQFPPEIQEHIIDQLCHDVRTLRACALTCHAWRVRSRFHLLRAIHVGGPKRLDEICSYLRIHEYLVQSITISPYPSSLKDVLPVSGLFCTPLLKQLPNIRHCELVGGEVPRGAAFHPSVLTYLKTHSSIETLILRDVKFSSRSQLVGLVDSLPRLKNIVCDNIKLVDGTAQGYVELGPACRRNARNLNSLVVRRSQSITPFTAHIDSRSPVTAGVWTSFSRLRGEQ